MQVGIMLAIRKFGSARFAAGTTDNDSAICERLALAKISPSAISAASATIRLRNAANMIGGNPPTASYDFKRLTKIRMSPNGLPGVTPKRMWLRAGAATEAEQERP